jgi:hypothetical protein
MVTNLITKAVGIIAKVEHWSVSCPIFKKYYKHVTESFSGYYRNGMIGIQMTSFVAIIGAV